MTIDCVSRQSSGDLDHQDITDIASLAIPVLVWKKGAKIN